jgi:hypothetical protein
LARVSNIPYLQSPSLLCALNEDLGLNLDVVYFAKRVLQNRRKRFMKSHGALMTKIWEGKNSVYDKKKNKGNILLNPIPSPKFPLVDELVLSSSRLSLFSAREMMLYLQHLSPTEFYLVKKFILFFC